MQTKERIIVRYLQQRWYKKTLIITKREYSYFEKINSLQKIVCSGYLKNSNIGCVFSICEWPFEHKYFDLIIIDEAFISTSQESKALLRQLHFCLADDGEAIVVSKKQIRVYNLISKFLSNGFLNKKVELINNSDNFIMNFIGRITSKNFVAFFKKDNFFKIDGLEVSNLIEKPVKNRAYNGVNAKKIYKNYYEKK